MRKQKIIGIVIIIIIVLAILGINNRNIFNDDDFFNRIKSYLFRCTLFF